MDSVGSGGCLRFFFMVLAPPARSIDFGQEIFGVYFEVFDNCERVERILLPIFSRCHSASGGLSFPCVFGVQSHFRSLGVVLVFRVSVCAHLFVAVDDVSFSFF